MDDGFLRRLWTVDKHVLKALADARLSYGRYKRSLFAAVVHARKADQIDNSLLIRLNKHCYKTTLAGKVAQ